MSRSESLKQKHESKLKEEGRNPLEEPLETPMPEIEGYEFLVAFWHEAGTVMQNGMGVTGLTWQELDSWQKLMERELTIWQKHMIIRMSCAYASETGRATEPSKTAPYSPDQEEVIIKNRAAVAEKAAMVFQSLKSKIPDEEEE